MRARATLLTAALLVAAVGALATCAFPPANEVAATGVAGSGGMGGGGSSTGGAHPDGGPPGMASVPAGPFHMGCTAAQGCQQDTYPDRDIKVSAFAIDLTEVRQADYKKCVDAHVCTIPQINGTDCTLDMWQPNMPAPMGRADEPVVCVSWNAASDYCTWLGKRLPTEAEWEKAARGTDRRAYPWGDVPPPDCAHAMYASCTNAALAPVTGFAAGASYYGAVDMAGNASEWVSDWYDPGYYTTGPTTDPKGPATSPMSARVTRGGSYYILADGLFVWVRDSADPGTPSGTIGFRCAKSGP